jgi:hypothetical protein
LLDVKPDTPISIFEFGVPLIGAGYSQDEIPNGLFYLQSEKKIEMVTGNRKRRLRPIGLAVF